MRPRKTRVVQPQALMCRWLFALHGVNATSMNFFVQVRPLFVNNGANLCHVHVVHCTSRRGIKSPPTDPDPDHIHLDLS